MPGIKEKSIELIKMMPDECSYLDIMAELYFKQKVEQGLSDIDNGKVISHTELKEKMNKWKKSIGQ